MYDKSFSLYTYNNVMSIYAREISFSIVIEFAPSNVSSTSHARIKKHANITYLSPITAEHTHTCIMFV
jgi:hypothetical protein